MSALPADGVVRAAVRWWQLLGRSSLTQAWGIIRADAGYSDLSLTQYAAALDWLRETGGFVQDPSGLAINPRMRGLPHRQVMRLLFQRGLEEARPVWLPDADVLVPDPTELPQDALAFADVLNVSKLDAFLAVSQARTKIDLERRAMVGLAGERVLVERLESHWPGRVVHVSLDNDGLGFDIVLAHDGGEWHLEVKTTTRRGRLVVHLSRNEHEVSRLDPCWRLVVVGLGEFSELAVLATVRYDVVGARVPQDQYPESQWESVRFELLPGDLDPGLPFVTELLPEPDPLMAGSLGLVQQRFTWLPGLHDATQ